MLLKKNEVSFVIDDGVGFIKSVMIRVDDALWLDVQHISMKDMHEQINGKAAGWEGVPTTFAIDEPVPGKTEFIFHPRNDLDRDVGVVYYPHAKMI